MLIERNSRIRFRARNLRSFRFPPSPFLSNSRQRIFSDSIRHLFLLRRLLFVLFSASAMKPVSTRNKSGRRKYTIPRLLFAPNFHDARAAPRRAARECLDNYIRLCWPEAIIIADSFRNYKFLRDLAWRASMPACQRARWYREKAGC